MRTSRLLFSVVHFFLIVLIFGLSALFFGLPFAPKLQEACLYFFTDGLHFSFWMGAGMLAIGILFTAIFYAVNKGHYYQIKMNRSQALVDLGIVQEYVEKYWQQHFPDGKMPIDVSISSKQEIQITAEMSGVAPHVQKRILEKAELDLGEILAKKLGYRRDFLFTVVVHKD